MRGRRSSPTCTWRRPGECTDALLDRRGSPAIAYETVELPDRSLPLLAPMSEVAGRLAPQVGRARADARVRRTRHADGRGVRRVRGARWSSSAPVSPGMNAAAIALGMQAEVLLLDVNVARLRQVDAIYQGHLQTIASNRVRGGAGGPRRRPGDRRGAGAGRQGAEARQQRAGVADEARARCSWTSRSTRAAASRTRGPRRTPSPRTGCTTRSSTAWRTCPARCRTPPRTR